MACARYGRRRSHCVGEESVMTVSEGTAPSCCGRTSAGKTENLCLSELCCGCAGEEGLVAVREEMDGGYAWQCVGFSLKR